MGAPIHRDVAPPGLPLQVSFQSEPPRFERTGLAPNVVRGRGQTAPPVVKNARHVVDAGRAFDDSQKQIVILRAIEFGMETADLAHHFGTDNREMADVIAGQKIIRRPVRFKNRRIESLLGEFVFVGIKQVGIAMVLKPFDVLKQSVGLEQIVMIEKSYPFALGQFESVI